jgi:phage baseplate assembly protein V
MSSFEHAEHDRQIANLIRLGTIETVDHQAKRLKVRSGDLLTGWLPWPAEVGRNYKRWRPLREGTQVILGSPSGDPAQAVVIGMLYTQALQAPAVDPDLDLIKWDDGASLAYNLATHEMTIHSKGELYIKADGDIWFDAQNIHAFEKE